MLPSEPDGGRAYGCSCNDKKGLKPAAFKPALAARIDAATVPLLRQANQEHWGPWFVQSVNDACKLLLYIGSHLDERSLGM